MIRLLIRTSLVVLAVLVLGLPAAAHAGGDDVIKDCAQDGKLDKEYSQRELREAEANLPSDIDEYTDCRQAIRTAMSGGTGSPEVPGAGGGILTESGAVAGSQQDVEDLGTLLADASKGKRRPIRVGDQEIVPGNAGLGGVLGGLAGANGMPAALIAAMVVLAILAVVTAYLAAREKFPLVQRVALRILGR